MPKGGKTVRTMKAITFSGGFYGSIGTDRHLQRVRANKYKNGSLQPPGFAGMEDNAIQASIHYDGKGGTGTVLTGDDLGSYIDTFIGGPRIPHAYAGAALHSATLFFFKRDLISIARQRSVNIDRVKNTQLGNPPVGAGEQLLPRGAMAQEFLMRLKVPKDTNTADAGADLEIRRGELFYSEATFPGAAPPQNRLHVDNSGDEDIEGIGTFRDTLVICTRTSTYVFEWNISPAGGAPALVHPEFGCIAPNSMVEYDGGVAWISERGPVAMTGGGIRCIGADGILRAQGRLPA